MFSVNIDKLVSMTENETKSYEELSRSVLGGLKGGKNVAVIGGGIKAFKLANAIKEKGKKVLFIDGDLSNDVFLGKYKLGKDMKGLTHFLKDPGLEDNMICFTSDSNLNIIFTGALDDGEISKEEASEIRKLLNKYSNEYDFIVVDSDPSANIAKFCDGVIIMYEESEFGEISAKQLIESLENQFCNVLGVVLCE